MLKTRLKTATLAIQQPCTESWDAMQPAQYGRFCGSCQKTVVDFSTMSELQIVSFFENYQGGGLCGKIRADQQGKTYSVGKPIKLSYARQVWKVAAIGAGLMINLAQPLLAQNFDNQLVKTAVVVTQNQPEEKKTVSLKLAICYKDNIQRKKLGLKNWHIEIWQKDGVVIALGKTDENGQVEFNLTEEQWGEGVYLYSGWFSKKYFISNRYRNKSKTVVVKLLPPPPPPPLLGILELEVIEEVKD